MPGRDWQMLSGEKRSKAKVVLDVMGATASPDLESSRMGAHVGCFSGNL